MCLPFAIFIPNPPCWCRASPLTKRACSCAPADSQIHDSQLPLCLTPYGLIVSVSCSVPPQAITCVGDVLAACSGHIDKISAGNAAASVPEAASTVRLAYSELARARRAAQSAIAGCVYPCTRPALALGPCQAQHSTAQRKCPPLSLRCHQCHQCAHNVAGRCRVPSLSRLLTPRVCPCACPCRERIVSSMLEDDMHRMAAKAARLDTVRTQSG